MYRVWQYNRLTEIEMSWKIDSIYVEHRVWKLKHDDLYLQLVRDRFIIDRPRAEWRMQFLNKTAQPATLHITRHPMAVSRL